MTWSGPAAAGKSQCTPCRTCDANAAAVAGSAGCPAGAVADGTACACNAGHYGSGFAGGCAPCRTCDPNAARTGSCPDASGVDG